MPIQVAGGDMGGATAASSNNSSSSSTNLKRIILKAMKFKPKKSRPKTPADMVSHATALLAYVHSGTGHKHEEKMAELGLLIRDMKVILYGNDESEPVAEACSQLTHHFFKEDTLRLLIVCLPQLHFEARKDATLVVASLQRQPVRSHLISCNLDLIDVLVKGYDDPTMALHYGGMLRECTRHQVVARYVLKSVHMKKFFSYIQLPSFDVAADATATFKELMTRHKSTVAEFLTENYVWFFAEYNAELLESTNYITRRQATKLLGDILLDRSNSAVMARYVGSKENLRILMNLLRETSKSIQLDAFHVFKLFVANQYKASDIINILVANRSKLLRVLEELKTDKEDESFEADKAQVVNEISELVAVGHS